MDDSLMLVWMFLVSGTHILSGINKIKLTRRVRELEEAAE